MTHRDWQVRMHSEVVIITHRNLIALAPQPLYLARALSDRGVAVELISNAPAALRAQHCSTRLRMTGPSDRIRSPRLRLASLWVRSVHRLAGARVGIGIDITMMWPLAIAHRLHKFARVLYWLEPFYEDYGARASISSSLGRHSLGKLMPPEALIDVEYERLAISRKLCKNPASCFVLRNVPPVSFARQRKHENNPEEIRFVYSGSVTGLGAEGIELMARAVALAKRKCKLTVFPAEGHTAADYLISIAENSGVRDRIVVEHRVERSRLGEVLAHFDVGVVIYPVRPDQNNNSLMAAPNKLYEYLASGLAVLASSNETIRFVSAEGLGWNLEAKSAEEIAGFIDGLARNDIEECCSRSTMAFRQRYNYELQAEPVLRWVCQQLGKEQ
jgi:glycosyltransferase involved in cell wall biosynthesis